MDTRNKQNSIKELYTTPSKAGSFSGVGKFMKSNKLKNVNFVKNELSKLDSYTKFRQSRKKFKRLPVRINFVKFQFISDLLDMERYNTKGQKGVKYTFLLVVIDGFSKMVWLEPLQNKEARTVVSAFTKIFKRSGKPARLQTDDGKFSRFNISTR
jgi:hypothetical protein